MASLDLWQELSCSLCKKVYSDPVTLRCGHNFCRACIARVLDTQEGAGQYHCPDCRESFIDRPVLQRNITLRHIAERLQTTPPQGKSGVCCMHCIHAPVPAVKSCLHCEASLCIEHLKVHSTSPEHVLSDPSTDLTTRKCAVHKKILEYYCSEDSACICVSCRLDGGHGGHRVESLDKASEKKRSQLFQLLQQWTSKRSKVEKIFQKQEERKESALIRASRVKKEVSEVFVDIKRQLEDLEKRVLEEVSRQEEHALRTISDLIQQLGMSKDEISKKMRRTEALCHATDPLTILREEPSHPSEHCDYEEAEIIEDGRSPADLSMDPISNALHTLSDVLQTVTCGIYTPQPTEITLDVATCGNNVTISEDLRTAAYSQSENSIPERAERFQSNQVLSEQSVSSGIRYWDMEGSPSGMWSVGVCYPSIARTGNSQLIGRNDKSWALEYYMGEYLTFHNSEEVSASQDISNHQLRIHLDYEAGQLSFYELGDPIRHLHTFTTTFTEPLHAAFWVGWDTSNKDSWVKIKEMEK